MKYHVPVIAFSLATSLVAAEAPEIFSGLFKQDIPVKAQIGLVLPPPEIDKYVTKVEKAARADTKWFREFSSAAKPGQPLPYDQRLGLTKAEYDDYITLWEKRAFKGIADVMLMLRKGSGDTWTITSTGEASTFSTLRYSAKDDTFTSPNGVLNRIKDIDADASSILGAWTGMEWKFEEETGLGKTKENFALGRFTGTGTGFGLIVYRGQETSSEGTRLLDKSLVVRFPLAPGTPPKAKKVKK
jgi:hypothetical protein